MGQMDAHHRFYAPRKRVQGVQHVHTLTLTDVCFRRAACRPANRRCTKDDQCCTKSCGKDGKCAGLLPVVCVPVSNLQNDLSAGSPSKCSVFQAYHTITMKVSSLSQKPHLCLQKWHFASVPDCFHALLAQRTNSLQTVHSIPKHATVQL
jgi:hypothetical protein